MNLTNRILLNSDAVTIHREMWNFNSRQGSNMKCTPLQGMRISLYLGHFQSLISPSLYHRGAEKSISSTDEKISVELRREEKRKEDSNVKYFRELNKGTTCYIQTHIKMSFNLSSLTWKNDPMKMIAGEHKAGTELSAERWQ